MLYYKLELTPDDMIRVLDIVQDDEFIYATSEEFKKLKTNRVIDYNMDVFNSFYRGDGDSEHV